MSEISQEPRFTPRGPNPLDDPHQIREIIIRHKDLIICDGKLLPPSHQIWLTLKTQYNISKTPKALYTFVSCNKFNIKYDVGLLKRPESPEKNNSSSTTSPGSQSSENNIFEAEETKPTSRPFIKFELNIPQEKWKIMEPEEKEYRRQVNLGNQKVTHRRLYKVLKPHIWTDIIAKSVWQAIKWPCSWSFKGNYVSCSTEAKFGLLIRAKCGCGNKLSATTPNPTPKNIADGSVSLSVTVWGEKEAHYQTNVRNRPFSGEYRRNLGEKMIDFNLNASRIQKEMASEIMDLHDPYPTHLPSGAVCRKIKAEALKNRRLDSDPIKSIQLLKYSTHPIYRNCINEIGMDPFYVHLITPNQLQIYNIHCKMTYSRLILDATGKIVQKIPIPGESTSRNIFLYMGVIKIPGPGEGLIPVVQMLSERHNANAIAYWLSEWIRAGAATPSEVVLDDSAAMISACCRALAGEPSTANYLTRCLAFLKGNLQAKPKCYIRIDVAHFTNMIRKWPEISRMKKRTKEFFMRVIVLAAKAEKIEEVGAILKSIFIVALSETQGRSASTGEDTPCEIHKKMLLILIAGINTPEGDDFPTNEDIPDNDDFVEESYFQENENMKAWVKSIEENSKSTLIDDGDRDNIMHNPDVVKKIERLCYILPLWSAAMAKKMASPYVRGIGAFVEAEFAQIKLNLVTKHLRVDDFIREYLKFCDGAVKLASALTNINKHVGETIVANESFKEVELNDPDPRSEIPATCPACLNGDKPGGAHKCVNCSVQVHAIEGCSFPAPGEEEGYGQRRLCSLCYTKSAPGSSGKTLLPSNRKLQKTGSKKRNIEAVTCIVDRTDITTKNPNDKEESAVEGWRGISLQHKKRVPGFYWRTNPDFKTLSESRNARIGVLRNGMSSSSKPIKLKGRHFSFSNTCSFDAPCQIFAAAYCDSPKYKAAIDQLDVRNTFLDVAISLATDGVSPAVYKKRATLLAETIEGEDLRGGIIRVNCGMDASALLRKIVTPPTIVERRACSSEFCPARYAERSVPVLSARVADHEQNGLVGLEVALQSADADELTQCLHPLDDVTNVPQSEYVLDHQLSIKALCAGFREREVVTGPHLVVEIVGEKERPHTDALQFGVFNVIKCSLESIPRRLRYKEALFFLRGLVVFSPPQFDSDVGHYRGASLRTDGTWDLYDDLKEKVSVLRSDDLVDVHVLFYTI